MAGKLYWLVAKDLLSEFRAREAWPAMLLLGVLVAAVFSFQMALPVAEQQRVAGAVLWLTVVLAGIPVMDRSFMSEQQEGCLAALRLYPVPASLHYLSKLAGNIVALATLESVLVPLSAALSGVGLLDHLWAMVLVAVLANVGIVAVATLVSGVAQAPPDARPSSVRHSLTCVLTLPLLLPVVVAAAEATRLMVYGDFGVAWWRWVQLLAGFAVIFVTAGIVLFPAALEE